MKITLLLLSVLLPIMVLAEEKEVQSNKGDYEHLERIAKRDKVNTAVDKGLAYLVSKQDPTDGHFSDGNMPITHTALSCMALMASGQLPGRSRYGDNLHRGIMYLVKASKKDGGYFGKEGNARMYGHGITTLTLCEAYGMMPNEEDNRRIKEAIERAIKVIIKAQVQKKGNHTGGWRYGIQSHDSDLSVAVWQVLALRSAKNSNIPVPEKVITDAVQYVKGCYVDQHKGYAYQPGHGPSDAMRAAGVVCMLAMGENKDPIDKDHIKQSASILLKTDPKGGGYYYYTTYYRATAANMMGEEYRKSLLPKIEKVLIELQKPNGEFQKHGGHFGEVYSTAFAVICLCVDYQYLPIYQE